METKDKELMLGGGYRSYTDGLQGFSLYFIQVAWKDAIARLLSKLGKEICQVCLGEKNGDRSSEDKVWLQQYFRDNAK